MRNHSRNSQTIGRRRQPLRRRRRRRLVSIANELRVGHTSQKLITLSDSAHAGIRMFENLCTKLMLLYLLIVIITVSNSSCVYASRADLRAFDSIFLAVIADVPACVRLGKLTARARARRKPEGETGTARSTFAESSDRKSPPREQRTDIGHFFWGGVYKGNGRVMNRISLLGCCPRCTNAYLSNL